MIEAKSPNGHSIRDTAALMKLLGDPTRIRLIGLLRDGEQHVTSLCGHLEIAQPTVSHHLGLLRNAGLLCSRRNGKQIHYSLNPKHLSSDGNGGVHLTLGSIEVHLSDVVAEAEADASSQEPEPQLAGAASSLTFSSR